MGFAVESKIVVIIPAFVIRTFPSVYGTDIRPYIFQIYSSVLPGGWNFFDQELISYHYSSSFSSFWGDSATVFEKISDSVVPNRIGMKFGGLFGTIPPNFIPIRFVTTEPEIFSKTVAPKRRTLFVLRVNNNNNNKVDDMGSVPDPNSYC